MTPVSLKNQFLQRFAGSRRLVALAQFLRFVRDDAGIADGQVLPLGLDDRNWPNLVGRGPL